MKFLVFALCVSAASAASFGFTPYRQQQVANVFSQSGASPVRYTSNVPVASAKAAFSPKDAYGYAPVNSAAPAIVPSAVYGSGLVSPADNIVAPKGVSSSVVESQVDVAVIPKSVYGSTPASAVNPTVAPKSVYRNTPVSPNYRAVAPKAVYGSVPVPKAVPAVYDNSPVVNDVLVAAPKSAYSSAFASVNAFPVVASKAVIKTADEYSAEILRSDSEIAPDGFNYYYETSNGIAAQSSGVQKKIEDSEAVVFQGSFRYIAPNGQPIQVTYVADENGFHPQGEHLPVGPSIPEAILRSLEYQRTHPPKSENEYQSNKRF